MKDERSSKNDSTLPPLYFHPPSFRPHPLVSFFFLYFILHPFAFSLFGTEHLTHYPNGQLQKKLTLTHDEIDGHYEEWYEAAEDQPTQKKTDGNYLLGQRHGTWKVWYPNGLVKSVGNYHRGQLHGTAEEWHSHTVDHLPALKMKGQYHYGKKEGEWKAYHPTGRLAISQTFVDDLLEGTVDEYYENSVLKHTTPFIKGAKEGKVISYHPNGKVKSVGICHNDNPDGSYKEFYASGTRAIFGKYHQGLPVNTWHWFAKDGKTHLASSAFVNGTGTMLAFYLSGQRKSETNYVSGIKHGKETRWHRSGNLKSKTPFHQGNPHGTYNEYHDHGTLLAEGHFDHGTRQGTFQWWYGNGQQRLTTTFLDDAPHGAWEECHENGSKKCIGQWHHGTREGLWVWYDRYENKVLEQSYE